MRHVGDLLHQKWCERDWLIIGKGPSFDRLGEFNLSSLFESIALNHTIEHVQIDIARAMDLDVVHTCADAIDANVTILVVSLRELYDAVGK